MMNQMFPPTDYNSRSPYEELNSLTRAQNGAIAIGRIKDIDTAKRLATIKTFMGPPAVSDLEIPNCILVFPDANIDGSEVVSMYRKNTIGLVFFIGGTTFFFGGIKPWNSGTGDPNEVGQGTSLGKEVRALDAGDKIISTKRGSHVAVLANGQIDLVSEGNLLLRNYQPQGKLIRDVCDQYTRSWSGGEKRQMILDPLVKMMMDYEENRRDFYRTFIMTTEKGSVGADGIYRRQMGAGVPAVPGIPLPIYEETLSILGEKSFTISPGGLPTVSVTYGPEGSLSVVIGALQNFTLDVSPSGATSLAINSLLTVDLSETGDVSVAGPVGSVNMDAQGNFEVANAVGTIAMSAQGDLEVANATGTFMMDGQGNFTLEGPTHGITMNNGDVLIEEAVGGSLSLSKGKIALTAAAGEVLEQFGETLKGLDELLTALQAEQHVGNLGFPTPPPVNVADYVKAQVGFKKIATLIDAMKG